MTRERRRYYRIEEDILIALSLIEASELDARLEDFWSNEQAFVIRNDYNNQISQHIADRQFIEKKMPELGRYLSVMQQQIERLSDKIIVEDVEQSMQSKTSNLSAQGISFHHEAAPQEGEIVELNLKLLPSGLRLVIMARVVLVETDSSQGQGENKISLDFEHLHEADREILIKHIHGKQMEALSSAQES